MGQGDDSVVKESLTTQTAEEAAREFATDNSEHFRFGANLDRSEIEEIIEVAYLAGREAERKSEKVLGEYWVLIKPGNSEFPIGSSTYRTEEAARSVAAVDILGYVPVKVKLVEVPQ